MVSHRLRLRTQLLLAMLAVACVLTSAILLVVRQSVHSEIHKQTLDATAAAAAAFRRVQQEQVLGLSSTAELIAELPSLKALMTTVDAPTIQDASQGFWKTSRGDFLVLASRDGRIMAVHANSTALNRATAADMLNAISNQKQPRGWWRVDNELYFVVAQPITAGSGADQQMLGILAIGRQMNAAVAQQLARLAGSEIALVAGNTIVASTLGTTERAELQRVLQQGSVPSTLHLAGRGFETASVRLDAEGAPIRCDILLPLDAEYALRDRLNRTITMLGLLALLGGALLINMISGTITRPVERLVRAARALAAGDPAYSVEPRGSAEIAELSAAFATMRSQLLESQRKQLQAERLAALGRAASSISHDLRHHLATVLANAEFLRDAEQFKLDRGEVHQEIERASARMTDLIDSLVEIARDRNAISPAEADLQQVARSAIEQVRSNPDFRGHDIALKLDGATKGVFDRRKIERALVNVLLNACEATAGAEHPKVGIALDGNENTLACRVWDNGPGIPAGIRDSVFEPFVSAGKSNGTGLGLAIASKIIADHGGDISVESSSPAGTVLLLRIPRRVAAPARQPTADLPA